MTVDIVPERIAFQERAIPAWKRAVLKVGSSLLAGEDGLSARNAMHLARFVARAQTQGREVVIVSSGAVAAGRAIHRKATQAGSSSGAAMAERQAMAALGQARLIAFWQQFFERPVAQVLLTHDDVRNRRRYLNARATLRELLRCGALPVVNENDTVSVDELKLGDNDTLGAIVAALIDADMLFIATDIDGLYDADPRTQPDARPIERVVDPGDDILTMAGAAGSAVGTGGMRTKILAAQRASSAGIDTVLFDGTDERIVDALGTDRLRGTHLVAGRSRIAARKHWLRHAPVESAASIRIDAGAAAALIDKGASLLPIGVVDAQGEFRRGDLVEIVRADAVVAAPLARGVTQYSAADIRRLVRRRSHEIDAVLGYHYGDAIVHRDDMSLLVDTSREGADD